VPISNGRESQNPEGNRISESNGREFQSPIKKSRLLSPEVTSAYGAGTGGVFSYTIQWAYLKLSHGDIMPEVVAIGISVGLTWLFVRLSDWMDKLIDRSIAKKNGTEK
jgi:hypothetical protein